jgi:hypothetical protein
MLPIGAYSKLGFRAYRQAPETLLLFVALIFAFPCTTKAQQAGLSQDQAIDKMIARERQEVIAIDKYTPIIETYIQEMKPDKELGNVPVKDHYFLGLANLPKGVVENSLLGRSKSNFSARGPLAHLFQYFSTQYQPEGFLQMLFVDRKDLDRTHYRYDYVRREFLGEVRCLVFDVTPRPGSGKFRFKGRIWANEQDYTIVRFNGVFTPETSGTGFNVHFDSWRANLQPGEWLPTYVFSQETSLKGSLGTTMRFKSQTRLWGYNLKNAAHESEFSEMQVEAPGAIQDQAQASQDPSPVEAQRLWEREAEDNAVERLQRTGFIAPSGTVDKVLATVVNNIEVTNNLDIEPEIRCRVLLTSTLESFAIGHTIVLSRGLLDVLPDEASLATMLAEEVGTILVTKRTTEAFGFNDVTNIPPTEVVARLTFHATPEEEKEANEKAFTLLMKSPYKDKLKSAGLFLRQLDAEQKDLPALINPTLGNRVYLAQELVSSAPALQPANLDQISALPLGGRIKLDAWDDKVEMVKTKPIALISEREKMPFEVTPFMPYLTYYETPGAAKPATSSDQSGSGTPAGDPPQQAQPSQPPASQPQPQQQPQN